MGRRFHLWVVLGLILGLSGCQSFNVRTDWDPTVGLADFQRYFWLEPPVREDVDPFADNTLLRKRVRFAIENALATRGFIASEARGDADFLVTYSVILEERLRVDGYSTTTGVGYRGRPYGFGSIHSTSSVRAYQESTLIIDFLDPGSDDLVWRGWATQVVRTRDRGKGSKNLDAGVQAIIKAFPPKADSQDP
jgi:hypothetical protein